MPFDQGRVTYCRFHVVGDTPRHPDEALLNALQEHAFREVEIGAPDEIETGFITGQHLLDTDFAYDKCGFGNRVLFALRVDTHKAPADLKKAYRKLHEQAMAAGNPSGFANKEQRREAREEAERLMRDDLAAGKFRKSKAVPLLWDCATATLFCGSASTTVHEHLRRLFRAAFNADLHALTAGGAAGAWLKDQGRSRDYEDLLPTRFTAPPPEAIEALGADARPVVPWVAKSVDLKDFLGNEFLIWLWHRVAEHEGEVAVGQDADPAFLVIDRALAMDCAFEARGKLALTAHGPARLPEARVALQHGKWPRKLGLLLTDGEASYELTLQGDQLIVGACKLPEIEDAENPRELTEGRLIAVAKLNDVIDGMYATFLTDRCGDAWQSVTDAIQRWIAED